MDPYLTFKLVFVAFLFLLSGFFSCAEAALFSLNPLHLHKMREERFPFFSFVEKLLQHPRQLLVSIIVGNEAVNIAITAFATAVFVSLLEQKGEWVNIIVVTPLMLIFCEAIPKTFGRLYSMRLSSFLSPFVTLVVMLERPAVWVLEKIPVMISRFFAAGPAREDRPLMEEEFRSLVDAGHKEGVIEKAERDLIHRVFDLADTEVSEIMTPRVDMFCLPVSMGIADMKKEIVSHGYSRIPVYGAGVDDIQGILYARDLLARASGVGPAGRVEGLLKKPYFVPPGRRADSLLRDFQRRKVHMAIVVDEYGGVEGLVTMEDILESLFGDIYDERDTVENLFQKIDDRSMLVSGMMPIDQFNELIGTTISTEDFDTVGGLVFHLFGKVPSKGEAVEAEGCAFTVEKMSKARILWVRVQKKMGAEG